MKSLKYFLCGIVTGLLAFEVFDKFIEVILLWIETIKINFKKKILKGDVDMKVLRDFNKTPHSVYDEDDYEDYEE